MSGGVGLACEATRVRLCEAWFWLWPQAQGDLFDVLSCGCNQALPSDPCAASEAGVAMTMQLLGVGKGAFDGLLAAAIDGFAPCGEAVGVAALAGVLPDMAGDGALSLGI